MCFAALNPSIMSQAVQKANQRWSLNPQKNGQFFLCFSLAMPVKLQ
jgi:hypothetical protein